MAYGEQPGATPGAKGDGKEFSDPNTPVKPGDQKKVPEPVRGRDPVEMAVRWERELQAAKKSLAKFHSTAKRLNQRYLDERDNSISDPADSKFNLFWSNIEVLKASLYAKPPNVDVSNSYKDAEDDVSRVAANLLQRLLNHDIEDDEATYPKISKQAVGDFLIIGLGQVWYRYEVETEKNTTETIADPATGVVLAEGIEYEAITKEDACADYVYWEDFWWAPCRTWQDCRWVARRVFMTREELIERFGEKIGKEVPVTKQKSKAEGVPNDPWEKAGVFEIWDKTTQCAYWHVMGFGVCLDYKEDPLKLRGFFPCPEPLIANATTTSFMPRADYLLAQDQYAQIDELTTRLKYLIKACKVVGAYDKNSTGLSRIFTDGLENQMIPVDNWAAFAEKGGIKGQMDFVPLEVIVNVIMTLTQQRDVLKANLYEVLGIGDIMRGTTNPSETLGAQQLKAQFGGNRLQFKQQAIGDWVADGQRVRAQIICDKFQPQTIVERSNAMRSPDAALVPQAIQMLKEAGDSKFYRITVEAEAMAMVDWAQERDSRTQFMQAVGGFIQAVGPLLEANREAAPAILQMMKWGLGGFRVSKEIETVLDQAIQSATQAMQEPEPPDPAKEAATDKDKAAATKDKTQAVKNLAEAGVKGAEAALAQGMGVNPGPGGMPMQPPPAVAPLQPAAVPPAPMQ